MMKPSPHSTLHQLKMLFFQEEDVFLGKITQLLCQNGADEAVYYFQENAPIFNNNFDEKSLVSSSTSVACNSSFFLLFYPFAVYDTIYTNQRATQNTICYKIYLCIRRSQRTSNRMNLVVDLEKLERAIMLTEFRDFKEFIVQEIFEEVLSHQKVEVAQFLLLHQKLLYVDCNFLQQLMLSRLWNSLSFLMLLRFQNSSFLDFEI